MTPRVTREIHDGIRGSEWVTFENSSHMARRTTFLTWVAR